MADTTDTLGYDNEWPQWADEEFELTVPFDVSAYAGYGLSLVYADRPKADPIAQYSLNNVSGHLQKLVTKSAGVESVITMYGQRATSGAMEIGMKVDVIFYIQKVDGNYNVNKQQMGDPAPFCTVVKGSKTELPDIS